ncbi:hypothetical protein K4F52_010059 [Lecanicillium sp. MT-2017a]|nr:hypothetical protein K4F52_010059 [Lecanicillium sp. MT-2017a]
MSYAATPIAVVAAALFWSGFDGGLNAINAFTALAFVYLAAQPMASILLSWSKMGGMLACFNRIQAYLLLPEHVDSREQLPLLDEKGPTHDLERFPIQFENASVATPNGRVLFTAELYFEYTTTTMVIGQTGVGKSMMLRSVLGEATVTHGSIYVQIQRIAYCDQEEWICNVTIRENIIGNLPYDEVWYNKVATACMLRDLNEFPLGHLTLAGTRGSNLSGGQRQRVELARAVYMRAKVVLLDGVLSAVDRQSAATILKQLIGEGGLLRTIGATVIMTTHSVELLKSADRVLVMHANGTVSTQSPEQAIKEYEGKGFLDDFSDDGEEISDEGSQEVSPTRHYTPPAAKEPIPTTFFPTGDLALYKYYLRSVSVYTFGLWCVVLVILVVTEKGPGISKSTSEHGIPQALIRHLTDLYMRLWTEHAPKNKLLFAGYAAFGVATLFTNLAWSRIFLLRLVPESAERLHRILIDSVTNATLSFITYTDSGALLNRFSQDMSLVIKDLPITFFYFTYSLFGLLVTIGLIVSTVDYAAFMIPCFLSVLFCLQLFYLRTSKQLRLLDLEAKSPMYTFLTESSEGIHHIRAFQWEEDYLAKGLELLDKSQKPFYYRYCIQRWLGVVLDLTVTATGVTLISLALYMDSVAQSAIGLGLLKVIQLSSSMVNFMEDWVDLETSLGALLRTRSFEKDTPLEENELENTQSLPENWPHRGEIRVENVNADHVVYGEDYRALHELSLEIAPGSKVGIVGRTGSGKTSFILTLLNFLKFSGSITIDGIDITAIPRRVLRSRITTISQEFIDLPGSVRDNLAPEEMMMAKDGRRDDAFLIDALAKVGLLNIITRAGGLDKPLKDIGLSAGQQQLLALARALLHHRQNNSKVVLVDEATNYIDYDSEEKLKEVMDKTFGDCTVLTISHRNYSLQSATNFLELSSGRLVSYQ